MDRGEEEVNTQTRRSGASLSTVLFLIFLVLKLIGTIDWSWWWVTAPLWIGWGLSLVVVAGVLLLAVTLGRRK